MDKVIRLAERKGRKNLPPHMMRLVKELHLARIEHAAAENAMLIEEAREAYGEEAAMQLAAALRAIGDV